MENVEKLPLSGLVTSRPDAAAILEKYNLDFCCKGKQTLTEALSGNDEKLQKVIVELNLLFDSDENKTLINYDEMNLSDLILYILNTHHRFVREHISLITMHLGKAVNKHGERHPSLIKIELLFKELSQELVRHMTKEEEILFPMIMNLEIAYNSNNRSVMNQHILAPIELMEHEHEQVGRILDEIRKLTWNYSPPVDACTTFRLSFEELKKFEEDLHVHVHLENNILFRKALEMQKMMSGIVFN